MSWQGVIVPQAIYGLTQTIMNQKKFHCILLEMCLFLCAKILILLPVANLSAVASVTSRSQDLRFVMKTQC